MSVRLDEQHNLQNSLKSKALAARKPLISLFQMTEDSMEKWLAPQHIGSDIRSPAV